MQTVTNTFLPDFDALKARQRAARVSGALDVAAGNASLAAARPASKR